MIISLYLYKKKEFINALYIATIVGRSGCDYMVVGLHLHMQSVPIITKVVSFILVWKLI
jgi:hypothetical protein